METAKRLQNQVNISVYCGTKAGFKKAVIVEGTTIFPCSSTDVVFPLDNWCFNRSLIKTALRSEVDVFEAHAVSGYGFAKKLRQFGIKKPFIHTIHGVLADEYEQAKLNGFKTLRRWGENVFMHKLAGLEKQLAQDADLVVTIGNYSLEKIQQHYHIDVGKVRVIPNGVDTERFRPMAVDVAKLQWGFGAGPCVLFVGSLIARKGLMFLVEAAKRVVAKWVDVQFLVAGEGPLRGSLEEAIKRAGMAANFVFLGSVRDELLSLLYNCADVFVLPSVQEGQGIVLLEAQATGKPVVAFDIGGVGEVVCRGETGLLVDRGDVDGLAEALLRLLDDERLRVRMGLNGRRFVCETYTWDRCAKRMFDVYLEGLGAVKR